MMLNIGTVATDNEPGDNMNNVLTTESNGREFVLQADDRDLPATRADLLARGFDGVVYFGHSEPTGRQRKVVSGIFYRSAKSQAFIPIMIESGRAGW